MEVINTIRNVLVNEAELNKKADQLYSQKNIRSLQWKICWLNEQNEKWAVRFGIDSIIKEIKAEYYMKQRHTILTSALFPTPPTSSSTNKHHGTISLPLVSWLIEICSNNMQKNSLTNIEYRLFYKLVHQYFLDSFCSEYDKISSREYIISKAKKCRFEKEFEIMIDKKTNSVIELGRGQYGAVFQVRCRRSGQICCMKRIWKNKTDKKDGIEVDIQSSIIDEVMIIRMIDHPRIVKLLGWYIEDDCHVLVLEFVKGKTLLNIILERLSQRKNFNENETRKVIEGILKAAAYFHGKGIIHRDLKPDNIMVPINAQGEYDFENLKLIDFGLAAKLRDYAHTSRAGTPYYMAPEVFLGNYSYKCDIWSIGVIMYMMLSAHLPLVKADSKKKKKGECPFKYFDTKAKLFPQSQFFEISNEAKDLLWLLLNLEGDKRPNAITALKFPWIKNIKNEEVANIYTDDFYKKQYDNILSKISKKGSALLSYSQLPLFEQSCLNIVTLFLSQNSLQDITLLYNIIDKDEDGVLSRAEFKDGLAALAQNTNSYLINPELLDLVVSAMDNDNKGYITYTTFIASFLCHLLSKTTTTLLQNSISFSTEDFLSENVLQEFEKKLSPNKVKAILQSSQTSFSLLMDENKQLNITQAMNFLGTDKELKLSAMAFFQSVFNKRAHDKKKKENQNITLNEFQYQFLSSFVNTVLYEKDIHTKNLHEKITHECKVTPSTWEGDCVDLSD